MEAIGFELVKEQEIEHFAGFLVKLRSHGTTADLEIQETAREFCRAICSKCTGAVADSLQTYWIALSRAKVGDPSDCTIRASSMGPTSKAKGLLGLTRSLDSMTPAAYDNLREDFRVFCAAILKLREGADTWMWPDARKHVEDLEDTVTVLRPVFEL